MTGLLWLAKNNLAFFNTFFSLRMRFSRRSRSFYWARLKSSFDIMSVFRCEVIRLFSADIPSPRSSATCFRVSPPVSAIRTTSWRNSSVRFSPIVSLLCNSKCYQRSGIKPRQVQSVQSYVQPVYAAFTRRWPVWCPWIRSKSLMRARGSWLLSGFPNPSYDLCSVSIQGTPSILT